VKIKLTDGHSSRELDIALRKLKKKLERDKWIVDVRKQEYFKPPSERRREKERQAAKKWAKAHQADAKARNPYAIPRKGHQEGR
jgi:ribosomal protein S21